MILALTGGIGSGKTIVSKVFETMGCVVYNSDEKAKELYSNFEVKQKVVELFGSKAYREDGKLDTQFVSHIIFNNKIQMERLNEIIHPVLKNDFESFVKNQKPETIVIKESALIFETHLNLNFKNIILVTAPLDQKIKRVMLRNSISKIDIEKRMNAQWSDEKKIPLANFIISNGLEDAIIPQALKILNTLKKQIS